MASASLLEYPLRGLRATGHGIAILREARARFSQRHPVAAGSLLSPLVASAAAIVAAVYIVPIVIQPLGTGIRYEISESDSRKLGTELIDSKGRWVGAFPSRLDSGQFNRGEVVQYDTDLSGRSFPIYPDHKTLFVEHPPKLYLACIKRLEDSNLGNSLINPHGVDGLGLMRVAASGFRSGGSTLSSQLVQQMIRPKGSHDGFVTKVRRKAEETFWTVPLMYGQAPGDQRFDQLISRHLPHVQYTQEDRSVLWGIEASSQVLWGARADDRLPAPQQLVLAGAVRRPLVFAVAHDASTGELTDKSGVAHSYWIKAIGRAKICAADPTVITDPTMQTQILSDLTSMEGYLPVPRANPEIEALGRERYGDRWPERARDPFRRANIFAYNAMQGLVAEFRDGLGRSWSRSVSSVSMSIDVVDERRFSPRFRAMVRQWLSSHRDLNPIYRSWATYTADQNEPIDAIPEVIAAATDEHGKIVLYYSSREGAPYFGSTRDGEGRYQPQREDRQLASLGKLGNALVLVRQHALGAANIAAYARSDSEAVTAATLKADPNQAVAAQLATRMYWSGKAAIDGGGNPIGIAWSMAHGYVSASPRTAQWAALAVTNAMADDARPVRAPSLIASVTIADLQAGKSSILPGGLPSAYGLAGLDEVMRPTDLIRREDIGAARTILSAPICAGGTLRALNGWCQRTSFVWAKTGTLDVTKDWNLTHGASASGVVQRLAIFGGVQFPDGRRYSLFLSIGGESAARPLMIGGQGVRDAEASALAPLFDAMLIDLSQRSNQGVPDGK